MKNKTRVSHPLKLHQSSRNPKKNTWKRVNIYIRSLNKGIPNRAGRLFFFFSSSSSSLVPVN